MQNVVIVGQGYVGLPLALAAVDAGHNVVGLDIDARKTDLISRGKSIAYRLCDSDNPYIQFSNIWTDTVFVSFGSEKELIKRIKEWSPDYLVVGSDYKNKKVIGSEHSKEVIFFDKIDGYSSTKIINYGRDFSSR